MLTVLDKPSDTDMEISTEFLALTYLFSVY